VKSSCCTSHLLFKVGDKSTTSLAYSQKLPIGSVSSSALVVRGKRGDYRDGDDWGFSLPSGLFSQCHSLGLGSILC
jgi:hypothetical protein